MESAKTFNALKGKVKIFNDLLGRVLCNVELTRDTARFYLTDTQYAELYHIRDCCELVEIDDVVGDITDLIGEVLVEAEEVTNVEKDDTNQRNEESYTWTYYKFRTRKGPVVIKFLGSSNGYYSESVDFRMVQ